MPHFLTTFHFATVSTLLGVDTGTATLHGVLVETNMPGHSASLLRAQDLDHKRTSGSRSTFQGTVSLSLGLCGGLMMSRWRAAYPPGSHRIHPATCPTHNRQICPSICTPALDIVDYNPIRLPLTVQ